jgi:hypothetical protein
VFCVGGSQDKDAVPEAVSETVIENAGSATDEWPSDAEMTIPLYVPTSALVGVPEILPVAGSSVAQAGKFVAENVSLSPLGSVAAG